VYPKNIARVPTEIPWIVMFHTRSLAKAYKELSAKIAKIKDEKRRWRQPVSRRA
jgi:hypothetical protein